MAANKDVSFSCDFFLDSNVYTLENGFEHIQSIWARPSGIWLVLKKGFEWF